MTGEHAHPSRRVLLKYGATAAITTLASSSLALGSASRAAADVVRAELFVLAGERTMIDGLVVPFVGFGSTADRLELPGGQLEVQTGDTVHVSLTNRSSLPCGFAVPGVMDKPAPPLAPGASRTVTFTAPAKPGTFCYVGTVNGSLETGRALGATGPLVVLPQGRRDSVQGNFPGVRSARQPLFGTMRPPPLSTTAVQERTWLFSELNPTTARDLAGGRVALPNDPEPEYFLINGISGMLSAEDHATAITGRAGPLATQGDVTLLRMINTGRAPRSVHMHGNHFWILSHPDTPWLIGAHKDTVRIPPATQVDVLVPMEAPPDSYPVTTRGQKYVVHDHIEMAETASGGHYPGGMVSELVFE